MGLFEHFPYSNFHDLNLNWIIGKIKNIEQITADVEEQSAAAVQSAADAAESAEQAAGSAEAAAGSAQLAAETVEPFTSTITEIRARMNAFVQQHSGPADETVLYSSDTPVFSGTIAPSEAFAGYQNIKFVWQHRGDICEQEFKLTGEAGQNFHLRDCFGYYGANNTAGWEMCQMQLIMQQTGELQFTAATVIDNLQYNDGNVDNTMNTGILQVIGIRNVADTEVVDARVAPDGTIYPTLEDRLNAMQTASAQGGSFNAQVKQAIMNCFNYVAWRNNDPNAQQYIDDLADALYPPVDLASITAVYTQSGSVYDTDTLDSLRADLVVTAHYADQSTGTVTNYALTGVLAPGISIITVTYGGKTAQFSVNVSSEVPAGYTKYDYITYTGDTTAKQTANTIRTAVYDNLNALSVEIKCAATSSFSSTGQAILGGRTASGSDSSKAFYMATDGFGVHAHGTDLTPHIGGALAAGTIYTVKYTEKSASPSLYEVGNSSANVAWTNSNTINTAFTLLNNPIPNSSIWFVGGIQIGKIKLFDVSETLIAEYTPCVRDSDSVIGIYDSVGGAFYTAATAASATIGNTGCLYSVGNWS